MVAVKEKAISSNFTKVASKIRRSIIKSTVAIKGHLDRMEKGEIMSDKKELLNDIRSFENTLRQLDVIVRYQGVVGAKSTQKASNAKTGARN